MKLYFLLLFQATVANFHQFQGNSSLCFERWLEGYKLISASPDRILRGILLKSCEDECSNSLRCVAFAYGSGGEANGTCELAVRTGDSNSLKNEPITLSDVEKSHRYDVYIKKDGENCLKRSPLYGNPYSHMQSRGNTGCFANYKENFYLAPELSRASFTDRTFDECRSDCIYSSNVLGFQCRMMSFRYSSYSGGFCQLSDRDHRYFRESDYIPKRHLYEYASVFYYDRDTNCRDNFYSYDRNSVSNGRSYNSGGNYYYDRYSGGNNYYDRYSSRGNNYYDRYSSRGNNYYDRYSRGDNYNDWYYGMRRGNGDDRWDRYNDNTYDPYYNRYDYYGRYREENRNHGQQPDYTFGEGHATVNGERCLRSCRENRETGFFFCEVNEEGIWDFCCRPGHYCGSSPGYSSPWCYVGTGPSQNVWRTCDRRYNDQRKTHLAYLFERPVSTIHKLSDTEVGNITRDNDLLLDKNDVPNSAFPDPASNKSEEPEIVESQSLKENDETFAAASEEKEVL